jgi:hypothetical protein
MGKEDMGLGFPGPRTILNLEQLVKQTSQQREDSRSVPVSAAHTEPVISQQKGGGNGSNSGALLSGLNLGFATSYICDILSESYLATLCLSFLNCGSTTKGREEIQ